MPAKTSVSTLQKRTNGNGKKTSGPADPAIAPGFKRLRLYPLRWNARPGTSIAGHLLRFEIVDVAGAGHRAMLLRLAEPAEGLTRDGTRADASDFMRVLSTPALDRLQAYADEVQHVFLIRVHALHDGSYAADLAVDGSGRPLATAREDVDPEYRAAVSVEASG